MAVVVFGILELSRNKSLNSGFAVSIGIGLIAIIAFTVYSIFFIRKLTAAISTIENASQLLASGKPNMGPIKIEIPEVINIGAAIHNVRDDIIQQTYLAEQIRAGNLEAEYISRHNHDLLGHALLDIKENLITIKKEDQQRNWASEGLAKFVQVLQSAKNLKALSNEIIVNLVRTLHANQGTIFLLVKDKAGEELLEMQACYAFNRTKYLTQEIRMGEGLIGQAFLEKETLYLKEVPDQFVRITSGLGEANPRYVLIVPLKMNETTVGIVELASFTEFMEYEIAFIEKIGESIAHTVSSFQIAESTQKIMQEMHEQAEQMRAQEEELRQNQEELQATQETISRKYDALFKKLGELNYQSKFDQLKSITSTKKLNVEYYFDIIRKQIQTFSEDRMIIDAVKAFKTAFYEMGEGISKEQLSIFENSIEKYYTNEFLPRLKDNTSQELKADEFMPTDVRALQLQHAYISNNPHPTGQKSLMDDAGDGSNYSKVHALYHPIIRNFLEQFGYYDIFLIDVKTGDMLYSVFKEVDFATSLLTHLYHTTNFGTLVKKAIESKDKNFVQLIDFEPYDPSYHAPASFIACPIYDGNEKTGILVFQMPINKINQILTGDKKWRADGLGESGETVIIGRDYKFRSISRELIENPAAHIASLKKQRYSEMIVRQIEKMDTNILMEEMKLDSVTRALNGTTGTNMEENNHGNKLLTAFAPLEIPDVNWIIISTMREDEASMRINDLREGNFDL